MKTPSQVSDCCESVMIPSFNHPDHAKLYLAANLINLKYLHKDIREQGGAYGSGASFKSGCCSFFSYRDPNPHKTFEHFEQAIIKASKGKFTDNDIKEAKLFVFSQIDHIVAPQNKGLDIFLNGITFEEKNIFRKRLLQVKKEDIQEVVNKYFVKQMKLGITSRSLFGKINDPSENEIDDYFLQNDWKITNSLTFLSDMYFEEKLDN